MPKLNYQKLLLYPCVLFFSVAGLAQEFQGVATYMTKRNFSINLDDSRISEQQKKMISDRLKNFSETSYTLTFSKTESLFQKEASLAPEVSGRGGVSVRMIGASGIGIMYVNLAEKRSVHQLELMGKFFLIEGELNRPQWKITQESKQIGNYTCYKATYSFTQRRPVFLGGKRSNPGNLPPVEEKEVEVVAWYTPQIPVSFGPNQQTGLPGLILELNDGTSTTLCTKVVINPEKKKIIKAPSKGKVVDRKDFEEIQRKQMQEMRERRNNNSGRGRGERIIIQG